ncbi:MAG: flippase-like domain-containing protein [Lentisphaeraceae bacterium]|nr:flippase-like domain-containing protein [Lentisphaeraceae bacterium]
MSEKKPRKIAIKLLAISAVFALIYWTIGGQWQDIINTTKKANKTTLTLSFLIYGVALYITCFRWHVLLKLQGIHLPHSEVLKLHYSGYFFNTTTPGAVTGDLIKIAAVMKKSDEKIVAAMSIFVDRLIGLTALLIIVLLSLIPAKEFLLSTEDHEIKLAVLTVSLGALASLICIIAYCFKSNLIRISLINRTVTWFNNKFPKLGQAFDQIIKAGDLYQNKWQACLGLLAISIFAHLCLGISFYLIGKSLGLEVSPILFILSMQISNALSAVFPLPGGLGLRDTIGKTFLLAAGTSSIMAATAPLLYTGVILSWGIIGAIVFVYWHFTK